MKDTKPGKNPDDSRETSLSKSNTSPTHKKPLTPTKDHPLMDLEKSKMKSPKNEFMDDSDDTEDETSNVLQPEESLSEDVCSDDTIINDINEIPPEPDHYQVTAIITTNPDDETNNNNSRSDIQTDAGYSDEEVDTKKLTTDKVLRRKSPSRTNNNTANAKNNNRMSYPIGRDRSQPRTEDLISKSTDKLDGKTDDISINLFLT